MKNAKLKKYSPGSIKRHIDKQSSFEYITQKNKHAEAATRNNEKHRYW